MQQLFILWPTLGMHIDQLVLCYQDFGSDIDDASFTASTIFFIISSSAECFLDELLDQERVKNNHHSFKKIISKKSTNENL